MVQVLPKSSIFGWMSQKEQGDSTVFAPNWHRNDNTFSTSHRAEYVDCMRWSQIVGTF